MLWTGETNGACGSGGANTAGELFLSCSRYEVLEEPDSTSVGDSVASHESWKI